MILALNIDQLGPGQYRAMLTQDGVEVTVATTHTSIAKAISQSAADVPADFAFFIEPRYVGISAGTMRITDACQEDVAEATAQAIVRLIGELQALERR